MYVFICTHTYIHTSTYRYFVHVQTLHQTTSHVKASICNICEKLSAESIKLHPFLTVGKREEISRDKSVFHWTEKKKENGEKRERKERKNKKI